MVTSNASRSFLWLLAALVMLALSGCGDPPPDPSADSQTQTHRQSHQHHHEEMAVAADAEIGTVDFAANCAGPVVADVDHALGLMHHMMYVQARQTFVAITEQDPDCAMAHWGVATTLFQPLWGTRPSEDELAQGKASIQRAAALAEDGREAALIAATGAFFNGADTAFWDRLHGWIDGMAEAYQAYPGDIDVASLYALALLTRATQAEERGPLHDEAEAILRTAWEAVPDHPGAIHYTIHATDMSGRERNALDMVEAYADIAPHTAHALHMPSHIYVRLGDWPRVIEWNARSAEAALQADVNGSTSHHYLHAVDYQVYALLQQGEDAEAAALFDEAMTHSPHQASFISAYHRAALPARLAVEQRDWQAAADLSPRTPAYLPWDQSAWPEAMSWYALGLGAVHSGERSQAEQAARRMSELAELARDAGEAAMAAYINVDRQILLGWIAWDKGEAEQAVKMMRAAAALETNTEKHPVEPGALQPASEALGDLLMELERPAEALAAYQASDAIWPGRYYTLLGLARAAQETGDSELARQYYQQLLTLAGESEREGVKEARAFL